MEEKNKTTFQLINENQTYILSISLSKNQIYLSCEDSHSNNYDNSFTLQELCKLSIRFLPTHTLENIQSYLCSIIEKQLICIIKESVVLYIQFILYNNDIITIPLLINKNPNLPKKKVINKIVEIQNIEDKKNSNLSNPIKLLEEQLKQEKFKNQTLDKEIKKLNNIILNLNQGNKDLKKKLDEDNSLKVKIKNLEKKIIDKDNEIQNYISQIKFLKENKNEITYFIPGKEKIISVLFMTQGSNDIFNYSMPCKNTDLFVRLEEKLYNDFPKFKNYITYFMVDARKIFRFKTLEENKIKSNDIISLFFDEE